MPEGAAITVALSGGLDSVVLLDLLQELQPRWRWRLSAAHFDHRMRAESGADAEWVRALCERRAVALRSGRAAARPGGEAEARERRYGFLLQARAELSADWLATAHQADDQAETVLFRLLRGSGMAGLAGIPERRAPHIVRPLLPFWRAQIEEYAQARGLDHREDLTNRDLTIARNWLRHDLIPALEAGPMPGLRGQLVELAHLARRAQRVLERLSERAAAGVVLEESNSRLVVARARFMVYDRNIRAHLLRTLVGRIGQRPGRVATRCALAFVEKGASGRRIELAAGVLIRREFDRLVIERAAAGGGGARQAPLVVPGLGSGEGDVRIAGARWRVRWAPGALQGASADEEIAGFVPSELGFPLTVRSWRPGDRIKTAAGTRKLKKLFVERRVGRSQRESYPLLADADGVLWVVGLLCGVRARAEGGAAAFSVGFRQVG